MAFCYLLFGAFCATICVYKMTYFKSRMKQIEVSPDVNKSCRIGCSKNINVLFLFCSCSVPVLFLSVNLDFCLVLFLGSLAILVMSENTDLINVCNFVIRNIDCFVRHTFLGH